MKVYINGKFLNQEVTGVQRVAIKYLEELRKLDCVDIEVLPNKYNGIFSILYEQIVMPFKCRDGLLISFCNTGPLFKKRQILFLHDVAFLASNSHSKFFRIYYIILIKALVKRLKKIITVSNFSRQEIIKYYGKEVSDKVKVIYNGLNFTNDEPELTKVEDYSKYENIVVTVSSMDPRKKLSHIIDAWSNTEELKDSLLLIVGGKNKAFSNEKLEAKNSNIVFTGYVSDSELLFYYKIADFYVSASNYEGFGLPVAESLNYGCIPLLSDIPVHKEIFGSYAYFFDNRTAQLQQLFKRLNDIKKSTFILQECDTWKSSAESLVKIIENFDK